MNSIRIRQARGQRAQQLFVPSAALLERRARPVAQRAYIATTGGVVAGGLAGLAGAAYYGLTPGQALLAALGGVALLGGLGALIDSAARQ